MKVTKPEQKVILKRFAIFLGCVAIGWFLKGRLSPNQGMGMMTQEEPYVLIQEVQSRNIAQAKDHIAHVEAINSVNLLPQISGTIDQVLFQEGSFVKEGDLLFVIDPKRYTANVALREAELKSAQANLTETERNYNRQIKLTKQNIASKATFDSAESAFLRAKAAVQQAEANLDLAKIDLDHTQITSPINGYIGKALVTKGNYVAASSQVLARIVQVSPVRVTFSFTDSEFLNLKKIYERNSNVPMKARITLPDGEEIFEDFSSRFVDNEVSTNTATVAIYTDFKNTDEKLLPGNYVRIALIKDDPDMNVMIPQVSLAQDEHGFYTYVINDDNIAEERRLVLGDVIGSEQVVKSGLNAGDKVIIQGLQKVKNGGKVKAGLVEAKK